MVWLWNVYVVECRGSGLFDVNTPMNLRSFLFVLIVSALLGCVFLSSSFFTDPIWLDALHFFHAHGQHKNYFRYGNLFLR